MSGRSRLGKVDAPTLEFRQLRSHSDQSFVNCDSHLRHSRCARNGNVSTVTSTVCSRQAHRRRPFYSLLPSHHTARSLAPQTSALLVTGFVRRGTAALYKSSPCSERCRLTTHSSSASPSFSRCLPSACRALKFFCFSTLLGAPGVRVTLKHPPPPVCVARVSMLPKV